MQNIEYYRRTIIPHTEFEPAVQIFGLQKTLSVMGIGTTISGMEKIMRLNVGNLLTCY